MAAKKAKLASKRRNTRVETAIKQSSLSNKKSEKKGSLLSKLSLNRNMLKRDSNQSSGKRVSLKALASQKKVWIPFVVLLLAIFLGYMALRYWIIAWVNNRPVTSFEMTSLLIDKYKNDAREELIIQKLTEDEGSKRGVSVSQAELDAEIKRIEEQQGGPEQLKQLLEGNKIGPNEFKSLVKLQLLRQKMFGGNINVTEQDVNKYLQDNKAMLPEVSANDASSTARLRDTAKEQLTQEKVQTSYNEWLNSVIKGKQVYRQEF